MKLMLRISVLAVLTALFFLLTSFTPPLFSDKGVSALRKININGDAQYVLLRGHDRNLPVLLFLHGGPGMPAMYLAHDFQRELEKHFVMVHWDQRGSGKSFRKDIDPGLLKISTLLADTNSLVDYLLNEFGKQKIWLMGHSHGSYLGVLYARRYPGKLSAYVGVGQIGDFERETRFQDDYLRGQLETLGYPASLEITSANREELLFKSGSELAGSTSFLPLLLSGLTAPEYSLLDILKVAQGSAFSSKHMKYDLNRDLVNGETTFKTPVAIIMGEHDMTTPVSLAREYYAAIKAPDKRFIVVRNAAHFPHYEQPGVFLEILLSLKKDWKQLYDPKL